MPRSSTAQTARTSPRLISAIALDIRQHWPSVSPYAEPYLSAMESLETIRDTYYADSAHSIILYFLSNATGWRGEDARRLKAELKSLL